MARKKETDYFEAFVGGVNSACAAADMLCTVFDHYEPEALPGHIEAMHKIEHSADIAKHGTMEQLVREFLPPIDREDIMELSGTIDDVTDSIEDVLLCCICSISARCGPRRRLLHRSSQTAAPHSRP